MLNGFVLAFSIPFFCIHVPDIVSSLALAWFIPKSSNLFFVCFGSVFFKFKMHKLNFSYHEEDRFSHTIFFNFFFFVIFRSVFLDKEIWDTIFIRWMLMFAATNTILKLHSTTTHFRLVWLVQNVDTYFTSSLCFACVPFSCDDSARIRINKHC